MKGYSSLYSSGYSSSFSYSDSSNSLHGKSQKYQNEYSVYSKMRKKDVKHGVYSDASGYSNNPTAKSLSSLVNGKYIRDKYYYDQVPYVVTTSGDVIIGKRNGNGRTGLPTPPPTLIGGKNPKVKMAGILVIRKGGIYSYDDRSGHYRPNSKSIKWADEAFKNYPKSSDYIGGITYE